MPRALARLLPALVATAIAVAVGGCGGGGDAGAQVSSLEDLGATTTIAGSVVEGPVSGATVTAYSVMGGMMGTALISTTTDAKGAFVMPMVVNGRPIMLRVTGGSYVDEATGGTVTFAPGQMMTTVLSSLASGTASVQVTPLTAMAQAMAAGMPGGMTPANIDAANAAVGAYFMVGDVVHTPPMNPLVSGSGTGVAAPMANYGIALAAMAQYAKSAGVPSSNFVGMMMQDAADGVLDGKAGTTPIAMGAGTGMMGSGGMMSSVAGGSGLASAMADFMNSRANASGLTTTSMTTLMQQLAASGGRLR